MQTIYQTQRRTSNGPSGAPLPDGRARRACLRGSVLRLGGLLGLQPMEVHRLASDLTGVPWACCGDIELEAVLEEYRVIGEVLLAKQHRRMRREAAAAHGRTVRAA